MMIAIKNKSGSGDQTSAHGTTEPPARRQGSADWHPRFLAMLPGIQRRAAFAFRQLNAEAREEAVEEVVANAVVAFRRLVDRNKADSAFPSALARFAILQVRAGRQVAGRLNSQEVSSSYCQRRRGVRLRHLGRFRRDEHAWQALLVENRFAGPAETAALRIDFATWLRRLPMRLRSVAEVLAAGEGTGEAARKFGVSRGRVSQFRRQLEASWNRYQTDGPTPERAPA